VNEHAPAGETTSLLTVPNLFTLLRLLCLPLFLYLLFVRDNRAAAGWLLGGLGATDWIDGYLARRLGQVSEFGRKFDPTVDRVVFIVAIVAIIIDEAAPVWFCWLVLIREVLVGGAVAIATLFFRMPRFDVSWWGKLATFLLMFAIPGFVIGSSEFPGHDAFWIAAWFVGIPGLVISWITAFGYLRKIRASVAAGRAARVVAAAGPPR
jgi:cardiolipin synthase